MIVDWTSITPVTQKAAQRRATIASVMARRGITDAERHERSIQAARRMVSRGERPGYRLRIAPKGAWTVEGWSTVTGTAASRRDVPAAARATIAAILEVSPDSFDVEV